MGGRPRGEVASRLIIDSLLASASAWQGRVLDLETQRLEARKAVETAHAAVVAANAGRSAQESMGTTVAAVFVFEDRFIFLNVGDSQAFVAAPAFGKVRVAQLSREHTVASRLILQGAPPSLMVNPVMRSLTQAIGIGRIDPHLIDGIFGIGDTIVICSDGITDYVDAGELRTMLQREEVEPMELVKDLVAVALKGGGGDNCSCVCVKREE